MPNENYETLHQILMIAQSAAHAAGEHIKNNFRTGRNTIEVKENDKKNIVSDVDKKAEEIILSVLQKTFPDDTFICEESEHAEGKSDYTWYIDPLDGTTNFVRGIPIFAVSIGLSYKDEPVLGIIYNPVSNESFSGIVGHKAWLNNEEITSDPNVEVSESLIALTSSNRDYGLYKQFIDEWIVKLGKIRIFASSAIALAYTAAGFVDGTVGERMRFYDVAAGIAIIRAAGGKVEVTKRTDGSYTVLANVNE